MSVGKASQSGGIVEGLGADKMKKPWKIEMVEKREKSGAPQASMMD
jgi:hypothetical protein